MEEDLKQYLEGMESRIMIRFEGVDSRLTHVEGMESRIMIRFEGVDSRLTHVEGMESRIMSRVEGRIDACEDRMKLEMSQKAEGVENRLLDEFWKWGRTAEMRTRQALVNVTEFNERLMAVEDRVSSLERKSAQSN
jgi:hypothetical protein